MNVRRPRARLWPESLGLSVVFQNARGSVQYKQVQKKHDDQELFDLILNLEDELLAEGFDPKRRHWEIPFKVNLDPRKDVCPNSGHRRNDKGTFHGESRTH